LIHGRNSWFEKHAGRSQRTVHELFA